MKPHSAKPPAALHVGAVEAVVGEVHGPAQAAAEPHAVGGAEGAGELLDGGDEDVDGGCEEVVPAVEAVAEVLGPLAQDRVVDHVLRRGQQG